MKRDREKLFTHFEFPEPPAGLFDRIMSRIREEQRLISLKRRVALFSIALAGSLVASVFAFGAVRAEFYQSGSAQFLSLVFSDSNILFVSWNDFALSILESLPALSIAAFLATAFVFLGSLRLLARNVAAVWAPRQVINN